MLDFFGSVDPVPSLLLSLFSPPPVFPFSRSPFVFTTSRQVAMMSAFELDDLINFHIYGELWCCVLLLCVLFVCM